MENPTHGLGAAALRAWLDKNDLPAYRLAERIPVSKASMSDWLRAGWVDGGSLPDAYHRKRLEAETGGEVAEHLFAADDERRRAQKRGSDAPAVVTPEAP